MDLRRSLQQGRYGPGYGRGVCCSRPLNSRTGRGLRQEGKLRPLDGLRGGDSEFPLLEPDPVNAISQKEEDSSLSLSPAAYGPRRFRPLFAEGHRPESSRSPDVRAPVVRSPEERSASPEIQTTDTDDAASDEYLGPKLQPGDLVTLTGLSKSNLNGKTGVVLPVREASPKKVCVRIEGKEFSVKRSRLLRVEDPVGMDRRDSDSRHEAAATPIFERLRLNSPVEENQHGTQGERMVPPRLQVTRTESSYGTQLLPIREGSTKVEQYVFDDDEMPPLEVVETNEKEESPSRLLDDDASFPSFQDGDSVMLKGFSDDSLNGLQGVLLNDDEELRVRLGNGHMVDVGFENLVRVEALDKDDDDDMPPVTLWPQDEDRWLAGDEASSFGLQTPLTGRGHSVAEESTLSSHVDWPEPGTSPAETPPAKESRLDNSWGNDGGPVGPFTGQPSSSMAEMVSEDDDMPPLEPRRPNGTARSLSQSESQHSDEEEMPPFEIGRPKPPSPDQTKAQLAEEDDNDGDSDMPPLVPKQPLPLSVSPAEFNQSDDEDGDMPPLTGPSQQSGQGHQSPSEEEEKDQNNQAQEEPEKEEDNDEDDMPPLVAKGQDLDDEEDDMPGLVATASRLDSEDQHYPNYLVEGEQTEDADIPPQARQRPEVDLDAAPQHRRASEEPQFGHEERKDPNSEPQTCTASLGRRLHRSLDDLDEDDSDMPPLETMFPRSAEVEHDSPEIEEEDDDMPPLETMLPRSAGVAHGDPEIEDEEEEDYEDRMPPLELQPGHPHPQVTRELEQRPAKDPMAPAELEQGQPHPQMRRDLEQRHAKDPLAPLELQQRHPHPQVRRDLEQMHAKDPMVLLEPQQRHPHPQVRRDLEQRQAEDMPATTESGSESTGSMPPVLIPRDFSKDPVPTLEPQRGHPHSRMRRDLEQRLAQELLAASESGGESTGSMPPVLLTGRAGDRQTSQEAPTMSPKPQRRHLNPRMRQDLELRQSKDMAATSESSTESTGSMPPVLSTERPGDRQALQDPQRNEQKDEEDDDDEMPPPHGSASSRPGSYRNELRPPTALSSQPQEDGNDSDDSFPDFQDIKEGQPRADIAEDSPAPPPPLTTAVQRAGAPGPGPVAEGGVPESGSESELDSDGMPPLDESSFRRRPSVQQASTGPVASAEARGDEDPAEVCELGRGQQGRYPATELKEESGFPFREGRRVYIRRVPKIGGQYAKVMSLTGLQPTDRIPVELEETGQTVGVRAENLEPASEDGLDSDGSLPPLETVSSGPSLSTWAKQAQPQKPNSEVLRPEDLVILINLKTCELNGEIGQVVRMQLPTKRDEKLRVQLKLLESRKMLSVKRNNVRLMTDEEMRRGRVIEANEPAGPGCYRARRCSLLKLGDRVRLRGLESAEYNGQPGVVVPGLQAAKKGRVTVKLNNSGRVIAVHHDKIEKVAEDPGSDDSVPPLEMVGKRRQASKMSGAADKGKFQAGQRCYLQAMKRHWANLNGEAVTILPFDSDKFLNSQVAVLLASGKRLIVKEKHLSQTPPQPEGPARDRSTERRDKELELPKPLEKQYRAKKLLQEMEEASADSGLITVDDKVRRVKKITLVLRKVGQIPNAMFKVNSELGEKQRLQKKLHAMKEKLNKEIDRQGPMEKQGDNSGHRDTEAHLSMAGHPTVVDDPHPDDGRGRSQSQSSGVESRQSRSRMRREEPRPTTGTGTPVQLHTQGPEQAKSKMDRWCKENQLPPCVLERLLAQDVRDPSELAAVNDEDLGRFTHGIGVGPKGRFLTAVRKMRDTSPERDTSGQPAEGGPSQLRWSDRGLDSED